MSAPATPNPNAPRSTFPFAEFVGIRFGSILIAVGFAFLLQVVGSGLTDFMQRILVMSALYVTLAVSLNLINGICGQFSIGHAAFWQVGAYSTTYLSFFYYEKSFAQGLWWLAMMIVVGALLAGLAGIIVGLPSLRLRGDYLAVVTLGFGEILRIISVNVEFKKPGGTDTVGGSYGMNVTPTFMQIWPSILLAILCVAVCRNLLKTHHGLSYLAVREDEIASSAMGVNTSKVKVGAFVLGSMFAGAAGVLFAHYNSFVNPDMFRMDVSFVILTMVVLGGTGSITGSVFAAILLNAVPELLRLVKNPDGTAGTITLAAMLAGGIGIIAMIVCLRQIKTKFFGTAGKRVGLNLATVFGAFVLMSILNLIFRNFPSLVATSNPVEQLRMVIFAITLITLMMLRPQGVFAHHEFSWTWVRGLFDPAKRRQGKAVEG